MFVAGAFGFAFVSGMATLLEVDDLSASAGAATLKCGAVALVGVTKRHKSMKPKPLIQNKKRNRASCVNITGTTPYRFLRLNAEANRDLCKSIGIVGMVQEGNGSMELHTRYGKIVLDYFSAAFNPRHC